MPELEVPENQDVLTSVTGNDHHGGALSVPRGVIFTDSIWAEVSSHIIIMLQHSTMTAILHECNYGGSDHFQKEDCTHCAENYGASYYV